MIRLLRLTWLLLALPAAALGQPVQVTSGEHDGFTRLVLDYGSAVEWQIGRTTDGYEVQLSDATPAYDLTGVYDLIGRRRLASVWVDPESGTLRIGIGCACHAQPFEFRPGIVVIDLKDGVPPRGSAFEMALGGGEMPNLSARATPRPRGRPTRTFPVKAPPIVAGSYDWKVEALVPGRIAQPNAPTRTSPVTGAAALPETDLSLQPLRNVLLEQLSRGAARGVVDMAPLKPQRDLPAETGPVRVRLHDLAGVRIDKGDDGSIGLTAAGTRCVDESLLDVANWGTESPVFEQMAAAKAGLTGEFDTPNPEAVHRAVRFLLFIGFGAEAQQLLGQFPTGQPDSAVLNSLGHIVDQSQDPAPAFVGMAGCDTSAALWAILSEPAPERGEAVDRASILRTFSALPAHLRRLLGPQVVDRFLDFGDRSSAISIRDAILRAPGDAGPNVALMEARLDLDADEPESADQKLDLLIASSGPSTPDAMIAQVATHLAQRLPLDQAQVTALESLLHERRNTPGEAEIAVAVTQARALAGDFDRAFADVADLPEATEDVWSLLAEIGPDSALLSHAIRPLGTAPALPATVASQLAGRLSELGFAEQARDWLQQVPSPEIPLAARIALQNGDARSALQLIAGSKDPILIPLRLEALSHLGDEQALASALAESGAEEARWRALGRAGAWPQIAASGPTPWRGLAATAIGLTEVDAVEQTAPGSLAQGQTLVSASADTRQFISNLLSTVQGPTPVEKAKQSP